MSVLKFTSQFDEIFINWIITIFDAFHRKLIISQLGNYDRIQIININTGAERSSGSSQDVDWLAGIVFSSDMSDDTECHQIWAELGTLHCNLAGAIVFPLSLSVSPIPLHSAISPHSQSELLCKFPD